MLVMRSWLADLPILFVRSTAFPPSKVLWTRVHCPFYSSSNKFVPFLELPPTADEKNVGSRRKKELGRLKQIKRRNEWQAQSHEANIRFNPHYKHFAGNKEEIIKGKQTPPQKKPQDALHLPPSGPLKTVAETVAKDDLSFRTRLRNTPLNHSILTYIEEAKLGRRPFVKASKHGPQESGNRDPLFNNFRRFSPISVECLEVDKSKAARVFIGRKPNLLKVTSKEDEFPEPSLPEIAFAGRSNSGKSSLINTLLNLKSVKQLPTSARPGETQELAFLELPSLFIVDLPGYGFALAEEGRIKDWQEVTKSYLASRGSQVKRPNASGKKTLKRVLVLIDARVLIKQSDHQFMSFLDESGVKYQLVLTKCDLVGPEDLARRYEIVKQDLVSHGFANERILMCSAKTRAGISDIRKELSNLAVKEQVQK